MNTGCIDSFILIYSSNSLDGYGDGFNNADGIGFGNGAGNNIEDGNYGDLDGDGSGAGYGNSAGGLDEYSMAYLRPDEYGVGSGYGNYHNGNGPFI